MPWQFPPSDNPESLATLTPEFLLWVRVRLSFSQESIAKYGECLRQVWLAVGDKSVCDFSKQDLLMLQRRWLDRNLSAARRMSLLLSLRKFLTFCREEKRLCIQFDPQEIRPPVRPKRQVIFLTPEELEQFISSIPLRTYHGDVHHAGLRLRVLVEALMGTALRISELLSLDRDSIDFEKREAVIIGKGNKQRTVFFTKRSIEWIHQYLDSRSDDHRALFVCRNGRSRLKRDDLWRYFARYRRMAGIKKKLTPHILRHTVATQLLFNGCPIGHIRDILGHERLETTCRYYLGLDHRRAKEAHEKYLTYGPVEKE